MATLTAGAIITAVGATGFAATTAISIGVAAVFAVGLTLAQRLLAPDAPDGLGGALNEGAKETVKQAVPKQRFGYGRVTMGGAIVFIDKNPPNLIIQYGLLARQSDALESVFAQGSQTFFNPSGNATSTPFFDGTTVFLQVSTRLGLESQPVDSLLQAQFPSISNDFRQRGHTVATVRFAYGADRDAHEALWGQESNIHPRFRLRAALVYDPRDPSQDVDDPATWKWTDNAVLAICDFIRSDYGGRKSSSDIDWEFVKIAASQCDQRVSRKDGTFEKRYTINGAFDTSQSPFAILKDMLSAMRGRIVWVNGKFRPIPGVVQDTQMTIDQDMLAGPFEYRGLSPRDELVNVVRSEFVAPERENQSANTPVLERTDLITVDGQRLEVTLKHPFVEEHTRAQRLNKAFLGQSRLGRRLTIPTNLRPIEVVAGEVVNIEFRDFPYVNGTYIVDEMSFAANFSQLKLELSEFSNSVYDHDPQVDEQDFVLTEAA